MEIESPDPTLGTRRGHGDHQGHQLKGLDSLRPMRVILHGWVLLLTCRSLGLGLYYPSGALCPAITFEV